jgi:hypothetical protein
MSLILLILALLCFIAAAISYRLPGRVASLELVPLGLAIWVLAEIVARAG